MAKKKWRKTFKVEPFGWICLKCGAIWANKTEQENCPHRGLGKTLDHFDEKD